VTRACTCLLLLAVASCNSLPRTTLERIDVSADPDANGTSGTEVDLVFAYDARSDAALPKSAADWFGQNAERRTELASGVTVVRLSLAAGTAASHALSASESKAIGVYSYANYVAPAGLARARLTPFVQARIRLAADQVVYANQ
jgi:type VI secretion system protein